MAKVSRKTLREHLDHLETEELKAEIEALYVRFEQVKEYYQVELSEAGNPVLDQYKKKIHQAYFPKRGKGRRKNSMVRKLIADFKKVSVFEFDMAELLLYRVECAVECANTTIQKRETYYTPVVQNFRESIRLMLANGEYDHFEDRCKQVVADAINDFYPLKRELQFVLYDMLSDDSTE